MLIQFLMTVLSQVFRCYDFWLARKTQHLQRERMKAGFSDFVFKAGMGKFVIATFSRKSSVGAESTVLVPLLPSLMYH